MCSTIGLHIESKPIQVSTCSLSAHLFSIGIVVAPESMCSSLHLGVAVKELITLRRDRPLLRSFTSSAFNGSLPPAGAAVQLVKAFVAAARVIGSQWRDSVRGAVALVPKADLLGAGGSEGTGGRETVSSWVIVHRKQVLKFSLGEGGGSTIFKPRLC